MNGNIKRTLSFVLIGIFAIGAFSSVSAQSVSTNCTSLSVTLSYGKHDDTSMGQVSVLQNFLHMNGYLSVGPTAYFGPMTRTALKQYQRENGLYPDGVAGPMTRASILAKSCGSSVPVSGTPVINSIVPQVAVPHSVVTLNGSGFAVDSIVHFGIGSVPASVIAGSNGSALTFTVPEYVGPYCKAGMMCPMYVMLVSNGTYPVYIESANGTISNTVQLTVTGSQNPALQ